MDTGEVERTAKQETGILRQLFDLDVKGRKGQDIVVDRLNPDPTRVEAIKHFVISPQDGRNLRHRLKEQMDKLDEIIKFLDKENGLR
jgi:hypothetical protein